jgi:hypothetical protein
LYLTNAPTYFKEVLYFGVQNNGLLSSISFILVTFVSILSGIISD